MATKTPTRTETTKTRPTPETYTDHEGKTLFGPGTLEEALALADECDGVRLAVSAPDGLYLAVQIGTKIYIKKCCPVSGRGGSVIAVQEKLPGFGKSRTRDAKTGRWLADGDWRPKAWRPL